LAIKLFTIQCFPKDRIGKGGTSEDYKQFCWQKYQTEKKDATSNQLSKMIYKGDFGVKNFHGDDMVI